MKFSIYGEDMKSAFERVGALITGKTGLPSFESVLIKTDGDNKVTFTTYGGNRTVKVSVEAEVQESGYVAIDYANCKKLFSLKGKFDAEKKDHCIAFKGAKKKMEVAISELTDEDFPSMITDKQIRAMEIPEDELLKTLTDLMPYAAESETRPIMRSIKFDFAEKRAVTCDGHRLGIRDLARIAQFCDEVSDAVVPKIIEKDFRKILNKKSHRPVQMYVSENCAVFFGDDFYYEIKLLGNDVGEFIDVNKVMPKRDAGFHIKLQDGDELQGIMKDYEKLRGTEMASVAFVIDKDSFQTFIAISNLRTSDTLENCDLRNAEELTIGFNGRYVKEALDVMDGEIDYQFLDAVSPSVLRSGEYAVMVLPVRLKETDAIMKFVA